MILYILDSGDSSVGIQSQTWEIQCPFEKDDLENYELAEWKEEISKLYEPSIEGVMYAYYDFESDYYFD